MIYIYDDHKEDYCNVPLLESLYQKGVRAIVLNNFMPSQDLVYLLRRFKFEVYISTKVFNGEYITEIPLILQLGAKIALDCEAYSETTDEGTSSHSLIWQSIQSTREILDRVMDLIPANSEILIYPEPLDPQVYLYYSDFLDRIRLAYNMRLMLELTYQRWKPWQIIDSFRSNTSYSPIIAVWPKKLPAICRFIQKLTAKCLSKDLFFYSENKTDWEKYL